MSVVDDIVAFAKQRRSTHVVVDYLTYTKMARLWKDTGIDFSTVPSMVQRGAFGQTHGITLYFEGDLRAPIRVRGSP